MEKSSISILIPSVFCSWAISSLFHTPISFIKVILQTNNKDILYTYLKELHKTKSYKKLYCGYKASLINSPFFAIFFTINEQMQKISYNSFISTSISMFLTCCKKIYIKK
jgi:hypothetical protein